MQEPSGWPADLDTNNIENLIRCYSKMLYKICLIMLCNESDAEDALQDTFLRYMTKGPRTDDEEYKKAWLIRVATNICKNMRLFKLRHSHLNIDELKNLSMSERDTDVLMDVMRLPSKYKIVLLLYYVEGYQTKDISKIIRVSPSTVRKRLQLGREQLRLEYRKE